MVKTYTSLLILPLLLFLEVGIGPLHNFLPSEEPAGNPAMVLGSAQMGSAPASFCPVCRFLQISFLLSIILFFSTLRRRCEKISVREIAFPAQPLRIVPSRGPPTY